MENLKVQEIQNRVTLFFDKQLGEAEKKALLLQVEQDPKCSKIFEKEKTCRDFIKNNVTRPKVTVDFINTIRNSINKG